VPAGKYSALLQTMEFFIINGSWVQTGIVWTLVLIALIVVIKRWTRILNFSREVKTELQKATWPWDPKEKNFGAKYKELIDSTVVVIIAMLLLAAYVALFDFAMLGITRAIFF
jgi:preprotein translocase subunit SecE